jgi:hypothetical protein
MVDPTQLAWRPLAPFSCFLERLFCRCYTIDSFLHHSCLMNCLACDGGPFQAVVQCLCASTLGMCST